jgi:hypothetical protein
VSSERVAAQAGLALDPGFTIRRFERKLSSDGPTYPHSLRLVKKNGFVFLLDKSELDRVGAGQSPTEISGALNSKRERALFAADAPCRTTRMNLRF